MIPLLILAIEDENDREFMAQLYLKYRSLMYKKAYEVVAEQAAMEDIAQDTIVALISRIETLRGLDERRRASYIANSVINTAINYSKREKMQKRTSTPAAENALYFFAAEASPEDSYVDRERYKKLGQTISKLPEKERRVLMYRYWLGKSTEEIAALTDLTANSVNTYMARARRKLKEMLEEEGERQNV